MCLIACFCLLAMCHMSPLPERGAVLMKDTAGTIGSVAALLFVTKPRPTLCDPVDWSPPGSSVHGISQARKLKWAAISFSRGSSRRGIKLASLAWQADSLPLSHLGSPLS